MKSLFQLTGIIILIVVIAVVSGTFYVVDETEQVIITQFGEPVGEPITAAGLHLKIPLIQQVNVFDKRLLDWDGKANEIPTRDKKLIIVDTNARWKIVDPLLFLQSVGDLRTAQARLDDIIDSVTRDLVSSHQLVEVVRNSNELLDRIEERKEKREKDENTEFTGSQEVLERIKDGREKLTADILEGCQKIVRDGFGLELVDVKIKRIIYVQEVLVKVYDRMVSERKRAAEQYRSEGQGKKAEIEGRMSKDLK
ncbi:MAG: protease modulator HflC, partial [bacterium]|nr:protease modulator HflC [bacterium]